MKLGISSWTYPWAIGVTGYEEPQQPMRPYDLLLKADFLGVRVVQIADNLPLHTLARKDLEELKVLADRLGLVLEVGTRGVEPEHLRRYMEIADLLGAGILRTLTHSRDSRPNLDQVAAWLRQVLPEFERAGVRIALENYERHTAAELAGLVAGLNNRCLGVCLDTVNNLGALELPLQVLERLAPHVINLHIKDFALARLDHMMGFTVSGRPAGEGLLDVPLVLARIREAGCDPNVILEQWPPFAGSLSASIAQEDEWAARSVAYLKRLDL